MRNSRPPAATTARFILTGKPLPRVEDSLRIGEIARLAVMSQAGRRYGEGHIPAFFSGHGLPAGNRHRHAFYLPFDSNGDGRLDRLLVHVPDGMDSAAQRVLEALTHVRDRDGGRWTLTLEAIGGTPAAPELARVSANWHSLTPYLHPWYVKKRFTVEDQIRRECRERGLPEPLELERMDRVDVGAGRMRRAIHFRRSRSRRGMRQADRIGGFWRLRFPEPVEGPLALGFACHFGLGLFAPEESSGDAGPRNG